jgi:hypothetical protein
MPTTRQGFFRASAPALGGLGVALLMGIAPVAAAEDDQPPIPKVGSCPVGYRTSGDYCIPLESTDKEVIIKAKTCPRGYRTSGNYCIKLE